MTKPEKKKVFIAEVHNNGLKVRLTLGKDELEVDASELSLIIKELGARRAMMAEPVPLELEPNQNFIPISTPNIVVGKATSSPPMVLLAYRHPGYGWQSMTLGSEQCRKIIEGMKKVLVQIDPVTGQTGLILPPT